MSLVKRVLGRFTSVRCLCWTTPTCKTSVQFDFAVKKELKTQKLNTFPFTKCFSFNYDKVNTYIIKKYMRENVAYFISFV